MAPKITVVTPSYNQARYLEETLRSVLSQRDQIHEYFVLDGGSNDGSAELIQKYADQHAGIDYWHSWKDKGQSDAIAQGFARATGDYLVWLNSDDVFLPGALARVHRTLERHPEYDVVTGYHVRIDADSRIVSHHRIPAESLRMARWGVQHTAQPTCFFRRSLYEKLGGLDLALHCVMDTDLWLRMLDDRATWGHIPDFLAGFRLHSAGKGAAWLKEYAEEGRIIHGRYPHILETKRQHIGLPWYRLTQIVSGRQLWSLMETRRNRGRKLTDVFGEWSLRASGAQESAVPASSRGATVGT